MEKEGHGENRFMSMGGGGVFGTFYPELFSIQNQTCVPTTGTELQQLVGETHSGGATIVAFMAFVHTVLYRRDPCFYLRFFLPFPSLGGGFVNTPRV